MKRAGSRFQRARTLKQNVSFVYTLEGRMRAESGNWHRARAALREAVSASPNDTLARIWLADLYATSPEDDVRSGTDALALATAACEDTRWSRWDALLVLASAHAETSDFTSAVRLAERALSCAPKNGQGECRERIQQFRGNSPWRDMPR